MNTTVLFWILRVSSLSVIPKIPYNAAYRAQISNNVAVDAYVLYAWQCLCERLTEKVPIDRILDKDLLRDKLPEVKSLMFVEPNAMREQLKKIFAECGIEFCIVKHFRGAPVQGFIKRTERGQLILCMTIRQSRVDIFWFTLFHEIAHVYTYSVLCSRSPFKNINAGDFSFVDGGKTFRSIGGFDNVKILVRDKGSVKAPEFSHTAGRVYAIVQDGKLKHLAYYDENNKQAVFPYLKKKKLW